MVLYLSPTITSAVVEPAVIGLQRGQLMWNPWVVSDVPCVSTSSTHDVFTLRLSRSFRPADVSCLVVQPSGWKTASATLSSSTSSR